MIYECVLVCSYLIRDRGEELAFFGGKDSKEIGSSGGKIDVYGKLALLLHTSLHFVSSYAMQHVTGLWG